MWSLCRMSHASCRKCSWAMEKAWDQRGELQNRCGECFGKPSCTKQTPSCPWKRTKDARWFGVGGVMGSERDGRQWEQRAVASYPSQMVELPGRKEWWTSASVFEQLRSNTETAFSSSHRLLSHRSHQDRATKKGTGPCLGQATMPQLHCP